MSNFILNLVQRSVGFAPSMMVQPSLMPDFATDWSQTEATKSVSDEALAESVLPGMSPRERERAAFPIHSFPSPISADIGSIGEQQGDWQNDFRISRPIAEQDSVVQPVIQSADLLVPLTHEESQAFAPSPERVAEKHSPDLIDIQDPGIHHLPQSQAGTIKPRIRPKVSDVSKQEIPTKTEPAATIHDDMSTFAPQSFASPLPQAQSSQVPLPTSVQSPFLRLGSSPLPKADATHSKPVIRPASVPFPKFPALENPLAKRTESRPIQVRIGTIEVRAGAPPQPAAPPAPIPRGFDDYVSIRNYVNWELY